MVILLGAIYSHFSLYCLDIDVYFVAISLHFVIFRRFLWPFWVKLVSIVPSSPVFTRIVVVHYASKVHGRINLLVSIGQCEPLLLKTSKQRHMFGESKLLIDCFNWHFLSNWVFLLWTESELLSTPKTCFEMLLKHRPIVV